MYSARPAAVAALTLALLTLLAGDVSPVRAAHPEASAVLPDLGMVAPDDFSVQMRPRGGRWLRFDAIVVNAGRGPFEVYGSDSGATVTQRIQDGFGGWAEHPSTATMFYDGDGHGHWHVKELQEWTIASVTAPAKRLSSGAKTGFCFWDNYDYSTTNGAAYYHPDRTSACDLVEATGRIPMGLSVGWGDEYPSTIAGQYIDITDLPYGEYIVTVRADQRLDFVESNDSNNAACARIRISRSGVTVREQESDLQGSSATCAP